MQNDQSLCRQQSKFRKKRRLFPAVQNQKRPSSERNPVSWQVAVSPGSAGLHLTDSPRTGPHSAQCHTGRETGSCTRQSQNLLKLGKWSKGLLWGVLNPLADKTELHCRTQSLLPPSPSSSPNQFSPFGS